MKMIYLVRHAKSSWKDTTAEDYDRPLNKRGINDAPLIGKYLFNQKIKVDMIIASPAKRAKLTAKIIAEEINYKSNIIFNKSIYEADLFDLIGIIKSTDKQINNLFLIGHNPSLNELANYLLDSDIGNIPTSGVVAIGLDVEWKDIKEKSGILKFFIYPKKLNGAQNKKAD